MTLHLSDIAGQRGFGLTWFDSIGSTNSTALEAARKGASAPHWFVAGEQTLGRGRRERVWTSPPGNLYASVLLPDPAPAERIAELCFVAALALDDAILSLAPQLQERLQLKWPNDLLLDGAKLAGILIEATTMGSHTHAVIGMGVNVVSHPEGAAYRATSLAQAGAPHSLVDLFAALSHSLVRALDVWRRGEGFAAIRAGWLARAYGIGGPIRVRTGEATIEGLFAGLDGEGQLVVQTPDGERRIRVGEVFFGGEP